MGMRPSVAAARRQQRRNRVGRDQPDVGQVPGECGRLPAPAMRWESVIAGGGECSDHIHFEVDPVRTMLPHMERLGLATAAELDVDTFADRVRDELIATGGVIVGRSEVAAWSRAP